MRSDAGRWWATRERPFPRAVEDAGAYRTVDADSRRMTAYELVCCAGSYQICRRTLPCKGVPPVSWTAEWWRREEAYEWWRRLLAGQAR